jgi:hypothetical protein
MDLFELVDGKPVKRDIFSTSIKLADVCSGNFCIRFNDGDVPIYYAGDSDEIHAYLNANNKLSYHIINLTNAVKHMLLMRDVLLVDQSNSTMYDFMTMVKEATK